MCKTENTISSKLYLLIPLGTSSLWLCTANISVSSSADVAPASEARRWGEGMHGWGKHVSAGIVIIRGLDPPKVMVRSEDGAPWERSTFWEVVGWQSSCPFIPTSVTEVTISPTPNEVDGCRLLDASLPGDGVRSSVAELVAHEDGSAVGSFFSSPQAGCLPRLSVEEREGQCLELESILLYVSQTGCKAWAPLQSAEIQTILFDLPW